MAGQAAGIGGAEPAPIRRSHQFGCAAHRGYHHRKLTVEQLEPYLTQLVAILNWSLEQSLRDFFEVDGWLKERRPKVAAGGEPDE